MTTRTEQPDEGYRLSVIIPLYNEQENIPGLYDRLRSVLDSAGVSYELVLVDDGSRDNSLRLLRDIKQADGEGPPLQIVQLSRNFGQHPALAAGFSVARGRILGTLDADLQIDPVYLLTMMDKMAEGYDFVSGIRQGRGDSWLFRRLPSRILGRVIGAVAGKKLSDYGCPLNVMRREIAQKMQEYGDMQRFFKPLAVRLADRVAEVPVTHTRRRAGRSKYRPLDLVDLLFDFITNFSKQIFQRVALLGLGLSGISFMTGLVYLLLRLLPGLLQEPMERLLAMALIGFFFGVQLLVLGVLGDFVIRINRKLEPKPVYRIKRIW
jgi:glycosyltransferase involved in cell wall biosynthesis